METRKRYDIVELPKEQYRNYEILFAYETLEYYDLERTMSQNTINFSLERKSFADLQNKQFTSTLYPEYWPEAEAYGLIDENTLIGVLEIDREHWSKRIRVTEIWIDTKFRRQGYGKDLLDFAKDIARREGFRAVILETQSCNIVAIDFYRSQDFEVIGFDLCCYSNEDIEKKEFRLEMAWFNLD